MFDDIKLAFEYLFNKQKPEGYNPNEGMEWNYRPDKFNLLDSIMGRNFAPQKPAELYGLDMPITSIPQDRATTPQRANYEILKQYNPNIAEKYSTGGLEDWEAQRIVNNGNLVR